MGSPRYEPPPDEGFLDQREKSWALSVGPFDPVDRGHCHQELLQGSARGERLCGAARVERRPTRRRRPWGHPVTLTACRQADQGDDGGLSMKSSKERYQLFVLVPYFSLVRLIAAIANIHTKHIFDNHIDTIQHI